MRIDRLISIIVLLLNKKKISAKELADKFEVSIRTIYRDIDIINLAGIPIVSFQGNTGGFGIMENYKIDRQVLTLKDMLLILSALKGLNKTLDNKELEMAIEKINTLVPKENKIELESYFEQFVFDVMPWGFTNADKEKLKLIQSSILKSIIIVSDYKNNKNELSKRILEPMTLVFKGYSWYLFAFCRLKNDYRFFKLTKMTNITLTDESFVKREKKYTDFLYTFEKNNSYIDIILKFSPSARMKVEEYFNRVNYEELENGFFIVKASMPEDDWVYANILSYGDEVEVLEPEHVRKKIIEKTKKLINIYKHDIQVS